VKKKKKKKREVKRKKKERKEKEGEGRKKFKKPKLAPCSHQPTRLLLPSSRLPPDAPPAITIPTRQLVSSCHRHNSFLTHLLPSPGPGSSLWTPGAQTSHSCRSVFSNVSVAASSAMYSSLAPTLEESPRPITNN
jgi:hypothetical protein